MKLFSFCGTGRHALPFNDTKIVFQQRRLLVTIGMLLFWTGLLSSLQVGCQVLILLVLDSLVGTLLNIAFCSYPSNIGSHSYLPEEAVVCLGLLLRSLGAGLHTACLWGMPVLLSFFSFS